MVNESLYSAETYVREPGDLWVSEMPRSSRHLAPRLLPLWHLDVASDGFVWSDPNGRILSTQDGGTRWRFEGGTPQRVIQRLEQRGIYGAVLYPSVALNVLAGTTSPAERTTILEIYNDWVICLAAERPRRLRAVALIDVQDVDQAASDMWSWAERGAAAFGIAAAPGPAQRYDDPAYEELWRTAAETGLPIVLMTPARSLFGAADSTRSATDDRSTPTTVASQIALKATAVWPARRSVTALTYAGVFARYPDLRIGVVGFGVGWLAYAMVRADEMYEVRPERTGPASEDAIRYASRGNVETPREVAGDERTGTVGMAPEGVGFSFPPGECFSEHVRRNVFATFDRDDVGLALRNFIGAESMLWGEGLVSDADEEVDAAVAGNALAHRERSQLFADNACAVFGFASSARGLHRAERRDRT